MIQRIQSIYLILIAGILLAMLFLPVTNLIVSLLLGLTAVLAVINVFCYKKRLLQIKVCYVILLLLVSFYAVTYFSIGIPSEGITGNSNLLLFVSLPLIAIILDFLAIMGIKKDEKLVKSLDRLR